MASKKGQKKRFWSKDEKHLICAQARVAGGSVAQVARWYSMNANLIHKWLRAPWFATDFSDDTLKIEGVASSLDQYHHRRWRLPCRYSGWTSSCLMVGAYGGRRDGIACKCCERIVQAPHCHHARLSAVGPVSVFWRMGWSISMQTIVLCIANRRYLPVKGSTWTGLHWQVGLVSR